MIKSNFLIDDVAVSTKYDALLENWRKDGFTKETSDSVGLVSKQGNQSIAVSRKNGVVWLLEGATLTVGTKIFTLQDSRESVRAGLGQPTGSSNLETDDTDYYYEKNLLGQLILIIRIEYDRGHVHNFVLQDAEQN